MGALNADWVSQMERGYICLWSVVILARPFHSVTRLEFFSVSAAFVLCVRLCAILHSVTFLIQRGLHRAASENL